MILALNLLVWVIAMAGFYAWWKTRQHWLLVTTVVLLVLYTQAQPSYLPKGEVLRSPPPAYSESEAVIQDRASKPTPIDVRDQRMREAVQRGLDFKQ